MIVNRFKILLAEKETRENRRLTYRVVSEETGLSTNILTNYAKQRVQRYDADTLETLCKYFGCEIGDLLVIVET